MTNFDSKCKKIISFKPKNERIAWMRKLDKMQQLIKTMEPIEDAILSKMAEKQVIMDEITALRKLMVKDCIHPVDMLVDNNTHIVCKFCNDKLRVM